MKPIFFLLAILILHYPSFGQVPEYNSGKISFAIESTRRKLPKEFSVNILSTNGLYAQFHISSYDAALNDAICDSISGISLQWSGKIFTLNGYEPTPGEEFTINVSGHKLIWPEEIKRSPESRGSHASTEQSTNVPTSNGESGNSATAMAKKKKGGYDLVLVGDETDTLETIIVSGDDQSHLFVPTRPIGPYTTAFDRHQVRLRSDMRKHDDMDLLHYIIGQYPGFMMVNSPTGIGYALVTTRGGSIRVLSSGNGSDPIYSAANETVALYIDGFQTDWTEATHLKVRDVQNMYVLRGNEAALFSARAVIALELRRYDARDIRRGDLQPKSITITPLGICE